MRRLHRSGSPYEKSVGFSRAVRVGNRVSVSGTAPITADGRTYEGNAYEQARRCLQVILEALEELGAAPGDVVRTRMYLVDPEDAEEVGRAHGEVFRGIGPASTMVVVAALLDPAWRVEIEAEALIETASAFGG